MYDIKVTVERVFSSTKTLITDRRNGPKEKGIIEAYTVIYTVEALIQRYGGIRTCCNDFDILYEILGTSSNSISSSKLNWIAESPAFFPPLTFILFTEGCYWIAPPLSTIYSPVYSIRSAIWSEVQYDQVIGGKYRRNYSIWRVKTALRFSIILIVYQVTKVEA